MTTPGTESSIWAIAVKHSDSCEKPSSLVGRICLYKCAYNARVIMLVVGYEGREMTPPLGSQDFWEEWYWKNKTEKMRALNASRKQERSHSR